MQQNSPGGAPRPPVALNPVIQAYLTNPTAVPPIPLPANHFWRWDNRRGRWVELVDSFPWGKFAGVVLLIIIFFPLGIIAGLSDHKIRPVIGWGMLVLFLIMLTLVTISFIVVSLR